MEYKTFRQQDGTRLLLQPARQTVSPAITLTFIK